MRTLLIAALILALSWSAHAATEITQYGITWKFDKDYETGQYTTGDTWVVGPVKIVEIMGTQERLAQKTGLSETRISKVVRGLQTPNDEEKKLISKALAAKPEELFGREAEKI